MKRRKYSFIFPLLLRKFIGHLINEITITWLSTLFHLLFPFYMYGIPVNWVVRYLGIRYLEEGVVTLQPDFRKVERYLLDQIDLLPHIAQVWTKTFLC